MHDPYILRCNECGRPMDERVEVVWTKVEGWEKRRQQGGTNHVAMRRPLPEHMCNACMTIALDSGNPHQQTLAF